MPSDGFNFDNIFHYHLRNDKSLKDFKDKCSGKFEEWFSVLSEGLVEKMCSCELCMSSREDREPDAEALFKDIMEMMMNPNEEDNNGKRKTKPSDS